MWLSMAALFHTSSLLKLSPPSFLGTHFRPSYLSLSLSILATPQEPIELLFQQTNNFLGKDKNPSPIYCKLKRTEDINCNRPAKERCLTSQESVRAVILETKLSKSAANNLVVIKGTPKYLTGRDPSGTA